MDCQLAETHYRGTNKLHSNSLFSVRNHWICRSQGRLNPSIWNLKNPKLPQKNLGLECWNNHACILMVKTC